MDDGDDDGLCRVLLLHFCLFYFPLFTMFSHFSTIGSLLINRERIFPQGKARKR